MSEVMIRWAVLMSLLLGCHSVTLEPDPMAARAPDGGPPTPTPPASDPTAEDTPGPTPVRRLTLLEYQRTLHDLLGDATVVSSDGAPTDWAFSTIGYRTGRAPDQAQDLQFFLRSAEAVAATAVQHPERLLPCPLPTATADEEACAAQFIARFGVRAYRRPLRDDEPDRLLALFHAGRTGAAFLDGIRVVVTALLQSPFFLYRWEVDRPLLTDGNLIRLGPYQLASRLSYALWQSMPDEALFAAAASGALADRTTLVAQARRMAGDPRFTEAAVDFVRQWLRISDTTQLSRTSTAYTPELARSMMKETTAFVTAVMAGGARLEDLLTSSTFQIDPALGALYGVAGLSGGDLRPVTMDRLQRSGILTQGAFLASNADADNPHPVNRGLVVTRQVLCLPIDDEGPNVDIPAVPTPPPDATNRQRWEVHGALACAIRCHSLIDPAGFAFEEYDAIGAYRTTDQGQSVDASGVVPIPGQPLSFKDAPDLVRQLLQRDETRGCLARQWLRYTLGRIEQPGEQRSLQAAGDAFRSSSYDLRALVTALAGTRAFTHRTATAGEGTP
jgi:hypothetical protein